MESLIATLVDAYNRKDLKTLMGCYGEQVELYALGGDEPLVRGRQALSDAYAEEFKAHPGLQVTTLGRIVHGASVIDLERIRGGAREREAMTVYRIEDGRVAQAWIAEEP